MPTDNIGTKDVVVSVSETHFGICFPRNPHADRQGTYPPVLRVVGCGREWRQPAWWLGEDGCMLRNTWVGLKTMVSKGGKPEGNSTELFMLPKICTHTKQHCNGRSSLKPNTHQCGEGRGKWRGKSLWRGEQNKQEKLLTQADANYSLQLKGMINSTLLT